jgi:hypothetical protein
VLSASGCTVVTGTWVPFYDTRTYTSATQVEIDHWCRCRRPGGPAPVRGRRHSGSPSTTTWDTPIPST